MQRLSSCLRASRAHNPQLKHRAPVTDRELLEPNPADWLMWRRTLNSWGYSPLKQIDKSQRRAGCNLVWTQGMGPGIQEGDAASARRSHGVLAESVGLDSGDGCGDGRPGRDCRRKLPEDVNKFLPVPSINRNLEIYGNQIIDSSADDYVFALDRSWENCCGRRSRRLRENPAQETSGPIIANGKVISARGCESEGLVPRLHHHGSRRQDRQGIVAASTRFRGPGEPGMKPGRISPTRRGGMWAPGWCRATTRS